jgi:hypothetical protein
MMEKQVNEQERVRNETKTSARNRTASTKGRLVFGGYRITQESPRFISNLQASFPVIAD